MKTLWTFFVLWIAIIHVYGQDMYYALLDRDRMNVSLEELHQANTLGDIHYIYPSDWVDRYIRTVITLSDDKKSLSVMGDTEKLNPEQKVLLKRADGGDKLHIYAEYVPRNTLKDNPIQEIEYTFLVKPAVEASYIGGKELLDSYVYDHIVYELDIDQREQLNNIKILFIVSDNGHITDVHLLESSGDKKIDDILYDGLCSMPRWKPAERSDGTPVKQQIKFFMSNISGSCYEY